MYDFLCPFHVFSLSYYHFHLFLYLCQFVILLKCIVSDLKMIKYFETKVTLFLKRGCVFMILSPSPISNFLFSLEIEKITFHGSIILSLWNLCILGDTLYVRQNNLLFTQFYYQPYKTSKSVSKGLWLLIRDASFLATEMCLPNIFKNSVKITIQFC